ncbi:MAG: threonine/serine dehydratase [Bacteroidota bacterium]
MLNASHILEAENRIRPYILQTPVEHSPWLSQETGGDIWLKLEHIQWTGSFKLRGAANKLLGLTSEQRAKGAITASTGNHGAAFAYIAHQLGIPGTIYLPETVAPAKLAVMEIYDVELKLHGQDSLEAELAARSVSEKEKRLFVSPYNDYDIMAGQGTIGLELEEQLPELDAVLISVGGGGLISGVGTYLKSRFPHLEIVGCLPVNSPFMYESVQRGHIWDGPSSPTLSDGTAGGLEPDSLTFPICQQVIDRFILLSEAEIKSALIWLMKHHFHAVEGAAALPIAALHQQATTFTGKKVAAILCGRKIGSQTLLSVLEGGK